MSDKDQKIEPKDTQKEQDSQPENDETKKDTAVDEAAADSAFDETEQESEPEAGGDGNEPPSKPKDSSGLKPIKWFIFLLVIAAIAYAIYFGWQKWQNYQDNMQRADRIDQIEQQLTAQQRGFDSAVASQKQQLKSLSDQLEDNQRYINQLQEQLRTTQRKIQAQNSDKQNEWLFNEAEYLIREASYKLNFTEDAASIVALLQAADSQLAELNDGSLTKVRQAISEDISAVRGSGNLDIEGIAIALETLKGSVDELELASVQLDSAEEASTETTSEADISSWQHFKNSVSEAASKYYTVHQFDETAQPFISPQKDRLLRENIALNLQTAQLASLQNNQELFQSNLQQVKGWVEQYFKQKPASTQAFLEQLKELQTRSVELDLPESLASYQLISQISQQKVNRWLEDKAPSEQIEKEQEETDTEEESEEEASA